MAIEFVAGDLLQATEDYIAQGVAEGNQEGLGTGLAFKISQKWPKVQQQFKRHARSGRFTGGTIWSCDPGPSRPGVIYLATQPDMYHATLPYLRRSLKALDKWATKKSIASVALPKIGAGLGKLSWEEEVKPLLKTLLGPSSVRYVIYEDFRNELEAGG